LARRTAKTPLALFGDLIGVIAARASSIMVPTM